MGEDNCPYWLHKERLEVERERLEVEKARNELLARFVSAIEKKVQ